MDSGPISRGRKRRYQGSGQSEDEKLCQSEDERGASLREAWPALVMQRFVATCPCCPHWHYLAQSEESITIRVALMTIFSCRKVKETIIGRSTCASISEAIFIWSADQTAKRGRWKNRETEEKLLSFSFSVLAKKKNEASLISTLKHLRNDSREMKYSFSCDKVTPICHRLLAIYLLVLLLSRKRYFVSVLMFVKRMQMKTYDWKVFGLVRWISRRSISCQSASQMERRIRESVCEYRRATSHRFQNRPCVCRLFDAALK